MSRTTQSATQASLAYDKHGDGIPVVFLHGLTFNRTTWRPWIEEWPDRGHFVHLAEPDRFAACLDAFIDHIDSMRARTRGL